MEPKRIEFMTIPDRRLRVEFIGPIFEIKHWFFVHKFQKSATHSIVIIAESIEKVLIPNLG
jgi:hypothetical protein